MSRLNLIFSRRLIRRIFAAVTMMTASSAVAQTTAEEDIPPEPDVLRIQHAGNAYAPIAAFFLRPWAAAVERDSDGALLVEVHDSLELGGGPAFQFDQVREGVIDGGWFPASILGDRYRAAMAMELPFMTDISAARASRAAWEFVAATAPDEFDDVVLVAAHVNGPSAIHGRGKRLKTAADFADVPIYARSPAMEAFLSRLGAVEVDTSEGDALKSLIRGRIEAMIAPWAEMPALDLLKHTKIQIEPAGTRSLSNMLNFFVLNRARVDALPQELQDVIARHSGIETSALAGQAMDQGTEIARSRKERFPTTHLLMTATATAALRETGGAVAADWVAAREAAGEPAQAWVDLARTLMERHAPR